MKDFRNEVFLGAVTLVLMLIKAGSFLTTDKLAGRDLVGAYSLVESFGFYWSKDWFLGFPMFEFYPPGFFFLADLLGVLIGNLNSFKLLVFSSLIVIPTLLYFMFEEMYDSQTALIGGFIGIFLVFLREPLSLIYQTLQVGLVAQIFGLIGFILFVIFLWKEGRGPMYLSAVLLGLTIIFHPFLGLVASLYLLIYLILIQNVLRFSMASLGYALSGWWWVPAFENLWYAQLYTGPTGKILNLPWTFLPFLFFVKTKKEVSLIVTGVVLMILGTFEIVSLQYYRAFIYGQLIFILGVIPGIKNAVEKLSSKLEVNYVIYLIGLTIILGALTVNVSPDWNSSTELENVVPDDGNVLVETDESEMFESYVPIQTIPLKSNATVVNGLYADSSISSPYLLGLERQISENPIPNPIATESNLSTDQIIQRLSYLDIEYLLLRKPVDSNLRNYSEKVGENRDFELYQLNNSKDRKIENVIKVSGSRSKWVELNEYIFRNELVTNIVYLNEGEANYILDKYTSEEIVRKAKDSETNLDLFIRNQSIGIQDNREAIFNLKIKIRNYN